LVDQALQVGYLSVPFRIVQKSSIKIFWGTGRPSWLIRGLWGLPIIVCPCYIFLFWWLQISPDFRQASALKQMIEDKIAKGRTMHLHSDLLIVSVVFSRQRLLCCKVRRQMTDNWKLEQPS
jgi:hypothetical protein